MLHRDVLIASVVALLAAGGPLPAASVALVPHPAVQDLVRERAGSPYRRGPATRCSTWAEGGFQEGREYTFHIRYAKSSSPS